MAMIKQIKYKAGYKYQLVRDYAIQINIYPKDPIHTEFAHLYCDGTLIIMDDFAWDGASGPAINTKTILRASLVHDVLYKLIRQGYLSPSYKLRADKLLQKICLEDGMSKIRAWWVFQAVNKFANFAVNPKSERQILTAP